MKESTTTRLGIIAGFVLLGVLFWILFGRY